MLHTDAPNHGLPPGPDPLALVTTLFYPVSTLSIPLLYVLWTYVLLWTFFALLVKAGSLQLDLALDCLKGFTQKSVTV